MDLYLILGNYLFDNLHHRAKSTTSQIPPENNCFSPSNWSHRKMWTSSAWTSRSLVSKVGGVWGGLSTHLTLLHRVYIAMCGFLLIIPSLDWQEQLAQQRLYGCIPLFQFPSPLPYNSHFRSAALVRRGRMTMSLIFKGVRLVNAFISMYTNESIISALLHSSNKLLHNFHTKLLFYSHYFWFFFSQRVFLCALHLPSSWVRDQVGAGKDSVSCSKTLEQTGWSLLWAWSPATLPCNPEHWQLIWISKCLCCIEYFYPALLFLDFLKRQHVINGFHVCIGNYNISGNLEATCNWWGEKDGHLKYSQVKKKR